jgi:hypothetical protein
LGQFATTLEIQSPLQTHDDPSSARQCLGLLFNGIILDVTFGGSQAFGQTIEQHLDQLNVVRSGYTGNDLD